MSITIRPAQARDIPTLVALINGYAAANLMLPRTPEMIEKSIGDWLVAEELRGVNGELREAGSAASIAGCGALIGLTAELAEVRSLAVAEGYHGRGVGSLLVEELVALARQREYRKICALTLRESFFERLGFAVVDRWSISPKLWQECIYCPKFHRCDEVAVLRHLDGTPVEQQENQSEQNPHYNPLLKWQAWQPLKLAYARKPIQLDEQ